MNKKKKNSLPEKKIEELDFTSEEINDPSIKKAKTLRKWNSMPEKKKDSLPEKKMEELNFTSEEINDQLYATTKMKKKKLVKKQRVKKKENADSDLIVIEDDSLKQKQTKRKYQIKEDENNDLTLDNLKKNFCIKELK